MAKGPGATEVGRVAIRVLPDTSDFYEKLKADLEKVEKKLKVEIPVVLDTKQARAQAAKLRAELSALGGVKIPVDLGDSINVSKPIQDVEQRLISIRSIFQKLIPAARLVQRSFKGLKSGIDTVRLQAMFMSDAVKRISFANAKKSASEFADRVKLVGSSIRNITRADIGSIFKSAGRRVRNLGRRVIDLSLDLNKVKKAADGLTTGFLAFGKAIGKTVLAPLTLTVGQMGNLGRTGGIVLAVLAAIPVAIGPIAQLLAGIPSLLFAAGAGAAAIGLGFDGIKRAFRPLADDVERLKTSLSATFEKGLTPQVKQLEKLFPMLDKGLNKVALGIINMTQGFTDAVTSAQGMKDIQGILDGTAKLFKDLKPFMHDFTEGLLTLGRNGAQNFGFLTQVLNGFAADFKNTVKELDISGELTAGFKGLSETFKGILDFLLRIFEAGVRVMGQVGKPLGEAFSSLGKLLEAIMPILGDLANSLLVIVKAVADALTPAFVSLGPAIAEFGQLMANLLIPVINVAVPVLAEIIKFIVALFKAFEPLFPVIAQIAQVIGNVLMAALNALKPALGPLTQAITVFANAVSDFFTKNEPMLTEIGRLLGEVIATAIRELTPLIGPLVDAFFQVLQAVLPLLPPLLKLIKDILPPLIQLFKEVILPIVQVGVKILQYFMPAILAIISALSTVIGWIGKFISAISGVVGTIIQAFLGIPVRIISFFVDAGKWLFTAGQNIIIGFMNGIQSAITGFFTKWYVSQMNAVSNMMKKVVTGLFGIKSPSRVFYALGRFIPEGFKLGISDGFDEVGSTMDSIAGDLDRQTGKFSSVVAGSSSVHFVGDNIGGAVERALSGWDVVIDKNGIARLVNRTNAENRKR